MMRSWFAREWSHYILLHSARNKHECQRSYDGWRWWCFACVTRFLVFVRSLQQADRGVYAMQVHLINWRADGADVHHMLVIVWVFWVLCLRIWLCIWIDFAPELRHTLCLYIYFKNSEYAFSGRHTNWIETPMSRITSLDSPNPQSHHRVACKPEFAIY